MGGGTGMGPTTRSGWLGHPREGAGGARGGLGGLERTGERGGRAIRELLIVGMGQFNEDVLERGLALREFAHGPFAVAREMEEVLAHHRASLGEEGADGPFSLPRSANVVDATDAT